MVATHNRRDRLEALLAALRNQTLERDRFEVVIVDDGSGDDTWEVLQSAQGRGDLNLRTIRNPTGVGPSAARDRGWRLTTSQLVAFTDDDCEPDPEWLAAGIGATSGLDVFVQGRTRPNPDELDQTGPFSRTIAVEDGDLYFQTCNIFYPRQLLERVDGFNPEFPYVGEDTDLAWRVIRTGARPEFQPSAVVFHAVSDLGPVGKLRIAARWTPALRVFAVHPELRRRVFTGRIFWKREHLWLTQAIAAALAPGKLKLLTWPLAIPYARALRARGISQGGGLRLAPFFAAHDLLEVGCAIRASVRYRRPML